MIGERWASSKICLSFTKSYGFDSILSPKQCGSYKELSAQHSLMGMLKRFRESSERGDRLWDFVSSLCKAFDCIDQNLIIIKLSLYGVIAKSINPIFFYSRNRTQGARKNVKISTMTQKIQWIYLDCSISTWLTCSINMRMIILMASWMTTFSIFVRKIPLS